MLRFIAGGTVAKDISSRNLQADVVASVPGGVAYAEDHPAVVEWVAHAASVAVRRRFC